MPKLALAGRSLAKFGESLQHVGLWAHFGEVRAGAGGHQPEFGRVMWPRSTLTRFPPSSAQWLPQRAEPPQTRTTRQPVVAVLRGPMQWRPTVLVATVGRRIGGVLQRVPALLVLGKRLGCLVSWGGGAHNGY